MHIFNHIKKAFSDQQCMFLNTTSRYKIDQVKLRLIIETNQFDWNEITKSKWYPYL